MFFGRLVVLLRGIIFLYAIGQPTGGTGKRVYLGGVLFPDSRFDAAGNRMERKGRNGKRCRKEKRYQILCDFLFFFDSRVVYSSKQRVLGRSGMHGRRFISPFVPKDKGAGLLNHKQCDCSMAYLALVCPYLAGDWLEFDEQGRRRGFLWAGAFRYYPFGALFGAKDRDGLYAGYPLYTECGQGGICSKAGGMVPVPV